jgi:ABC-type phosphate/phosphonate transport system substrate-binding protein
MAFFAGLRFQVAALLLAAGASLLGSTSLQGRQANDKALRIGSSGSLTASSNIKEEDALETLRGFLKEETGMDNKIIKEKNWREVADKLAKKELQIGVFQGYEFAWAQTQVPDLKPLMLAVKVHRNPMAFLITQRDNKATDFAGLEGQTLSIPVSSVGFPELFVEREALAKGKKLDAFFSKVTRPEESEDAIDDVVDGIVNATVIDQAGLEAYKRRKPGRFAKLKLIAQSIPFPSPVIAYKDKDLDAATLETFRAGLIKASERERGKKMLTMFRLTGFEAIPDDFSKVVDETRKKYPAPSAEPK